jgi:8-amino-7-oxononanoate synthase
VLDNAAYLRDGVKRLGYATVDDLCLPDGTPYVTPIVPLKIGDENETILMWKALWEAGIYANVAVYPAVAPGQGVIRMSVMASHRRDHLDRALEILADLKSRPPTTDVERPQWQ